MKKIFVSAVAAMAMVFGGAVPAAYAVGSNAGAFVTDINSEYGSLSSPSVAVGVGARQVTITAYLVPSAGAWAAIQSGARVLVSGTAGTLDGAALSTGSTARVSFNNSLRASNGNYLPASYGPNNGRTYTVPSSVSVGSAQIEVSMMTYPAGPFGTGTVSAGTYAYTPSLTIDGVAISLADYSVTYSYNITYASNFTASGAATSAYQSGTTCINTTGYAAGDVLTVTVLKNGVAGYAQSGNMNSSLGKAVAPEAMTGGSLATLQSATGVYTYTLTSNEVNSLLVVSAYSSGPITQSGPESLDVSVTRGGVEATVPCFTASAPAPVIASAGTSSSFTASSVAIAGFESLYGTRCYGDPTVFGPGVIPYMPVAPVNGVCSFNNSSASTTYNFYYRVTINSPSMGSFPVVMSAVTQSVGAVGAPQQQVQVQAPAIVFNQPKFEIPAKIAISASGKVSLSGKDMGVTSVVVGGKDQKIDANSATQLDFDTAGLANGVHDLVMKGAFGTYTVQKAIQVGEAVVTKVAAVSARQVGMAGGELSISGVGLEGTTQITMNGQVLEILSKTDSKVTFRVPASTVASVNSILISGSFVPVLFKNAFSYTK